MAALRKRLLGNFGATAYAMAVNMVSQLFAIPIFLHFWGNEAYGEWLVVSAIASYLSITDLGLGKVAANKVSMLSAMEDRASASRMLHSAWLFILVMSLIAFLVIATVVPALPLQRWLSLKHFTSNETTITLLLLTGYALLCLQGEIFAAIYRSCSCVPRGVILSSSFRLTDFLVSITVISQTTSTVYLALALLCNRVLANITLYFDSRRLAPNLRLGLRHSNMGEIKAMLRPSLAFMCFPIAHSIPAQGMTILIHSLLGSTAVVVFTTVRVLTRVLVQGMNLIKNAVWPEMSQLIAKGDLPRARKVHRFTVQTTLGAAFFGGLFLLLFGRWMIDHWTRNSVNVDLGTLSLFIVGVIINSIWLSSAVVLEATNQHEGLAIRCLAGSLLSMLLAWLLIPLWDIRGAVAALIAVDVMLVPYVLHRSCLILEESPLALLRTFRLNLLLNPRTG